MSMRDILNEAVTRVDGAQLAGVIGTDGIGVDMVINDDAYDQEGVEMELAAMASNAAVTASRMGAGEVRDIMIEADDYTYLAAQVTPGYFAVMGVASHTNLNDARFAVRLMAYRLQTEM
ncbi:MAG: hypothetical protein MUD01_20010 [Chloroflexaceae bacterium]|jgi:predicted regulator of Ras-like GTPase activity (Roadblock/LC7/MglB family)|nr:hypothetical protein [Chloroflexaceae bacterium]